MAGSRTKGGGRHADIPASVLVLCMLLLAGCGGSGDQSGGGGTTIPQVQAEATPPPAPAAPPPAAAGGMIATERVASCAGFTTASAAQFLGVPAADIKDLSADIYDKLRSCGFTSTTDRSKRVSFSLAIADSAKEAIEDMAVFREHLGVGQSALGGVTGTGADATPYETVANLGDEAVWARINQTLNVRLGNVTIQVAFPEDRAAQEQLAALVVKGLR
jgi:hypothetical protein